MDTLPDEQDTFSLYVEIKNYLNGKRTALPKFLVAPINQFEIEDSLLYLKTVNAYGKTTYRICLPPTYYHKALILAHSIPSSGHAGENNTIERLKSFAYWPTMVKDAKAYVKSCEVCLKTKPYKGPKAPTLRNPEVTRPWQRLNLDLIGPLPISSEGNKYILSVINVMTRYAVAVPIPDKSAATVARAFLTNVVGPFGPPESIYSDSGTEFTSSITKEVLRWLGIHQRHITVYRPQASGLVERFNGKIISILRCLVYEQPGSWCLSLPLAILAYNSAKNRVLRESPFFLTFLRDPILPYQSLLETPGPWYCVDDLKHELMLRSYTAFSIAKQFIAEGQDEQQRYKNVKAKQRPIKIGDRVYVKIMTQQNKLLPKYMGPMRVIRILGVIYWVKDLHNSKIYQVHHDRLKLDVLMHVDENPNVNQPFPENDSVSGQELLLVPQSEVRTAGFDNSKIKELNTEQFLNQHVKVPVKPGVDEVLNDDEDEGAVNINRSSVDSRYPLRNRGQKVDNDPWVMNRPLEYKR